MGVSENRGTPKSSILIRFSIINPFGVPLFLETPKYEGKVKSGVPHGSEGNSTSRVFADGFFWCRPPVDVGPSMPSVHSFDVGQHWCVAPTATGLVSGEQGRFV